MRGMDTDKAEGLIDVSDLPITDLVNTVDPALARSLQRILDDVADPNGVLSAFSSFV